MNRSFITGVDKNHEWMLKWWFTNVTENNPNTAVTICDFGMSSEIREWASYVADHFIRYEPHPKCAWFYKTQCLLDSPCDQTCWLDSDCEVLTNIEAIFEYAKPGKVGLTKDVPRINGEWWATGVVVVDGTPDILVGWNEVSKKAHLRGDQEAFRNMLEQVPEFQNDIVEVPNEYQWLRLQLARGINNPNKKVIHWTGPRGKEHIRTLVNASTSK